MKKTRIDLSQPFEEILATLRHLPRAHVVAGDTAADDELKQVLRGLYEAANGRHVATALGLVPIAPPVAPFLKEVPFDVETQLEFLIEAISRVIVCPSQLAWESFAREPVAPNNGEAPRHPLEATFEERAHGLRAVPHTHHSPLPPQGVSYG